MLKIGFMGIIEFQIHVHVKQITGLQVNNSRGIKTNIYAYFYHNRKFHLALAKFPDNAEHMSHIAYFLYTQTKTC